MASLADLTTIPSTEVLGHELRFSASTGSTNDDLKALAQAGAAEGLVLVTDEQTAGRGRRGRVWQAPPATSLLQSILVRPTWLAANDGFLLTMLAAVAAAEAIEGEGVAVGLKWPNDLQHQGRKLGGILVEAELRDTMVQWAVIGLGLNVNWNPGTLPELQGQATSVGAVLGREIDRQALFVRLIERLDDWYGRLRRGARSALKQAWQERLTTIGQMVAVHTAAGMVEGLAESVDETGALLVRTPDGRLQAFHAGEVSVRPAAGTA